MRRAFVTAFLTALLACSDRNEPGPTTRARLEKQAAIAAAVREARARPPPQITLGPTHLPTLLAGATLAMTLSALRQARPHAHPSRQNSNRWREDLGTRTWAHYTFHKGRLYAVSVFGAERASEAAPLRALARRRWGAPFPLMGSDYFRAPGAIVRIETELGNLSIEFTDDRVFANKAR